MMERLGVTFAQAPRRYGWHAVATWARHLPESSAVFRARHPKESAWASEFGRAAMQADQIDATGEVVRAIAAACGARPRDVRPYPRPWHDDRDVRKFGAGAIPVRDFDAWYYEQ